MKRFLLAAVLLLTTCIGASAQANKTYFVVGTTTDTAKPNTTKTQLLPIRSQGGVTLQYKLAGVTDTITGYASVWASVDDTTFCPFPGIDSIAISAHTDVYKMWLLNTKLNGNPVRAIQVRTRCPSNTTNATGKAKLTTKAFIYN